VKSRGSQCNETLLVRAAVRPGKKLGLQSAAKNLQWRRCPCWLRQTVPNRCSSSRREGSVANGGTGGAWSDQRWCSRRAQSPTCVEVWDALQIWGYR